MGKTTQPGPRSPTTWKHPHVRGEDMADPKKRPEVEETPPRAWGRPTKLFPKVPSTWKHPHVRGEDCAMSKAPNPSPRNTPTCVGKTCYLSFLTSRQEETPPRAWGRHTRKEPGLGDIGNTPTCVGKTRAHTVKRFFTRKHPHVRGEDAFPQR